jgi:hypothetical protein
VELGPGANRRVTTERGYHTVTVGARDRFVDVWYPERWAPKDKPPKQEPRHAQQEAHDDRTRAQELTTVTHFPLTAFFAAGKAFFLQAEALE